MPRKQELTPATVVGYFKSASLEIGELVLGLCQAEVKAKQQKSREAKARAHQPAKATANAAPAKAKATAKKRKVRKRTKPNGAQTTQQMVEQMEAQRGAESQPPVAQ